MQEQLGTDNPSKGQIATYVQETISSGKVVPGYGHAVLRKTDPRFTAQMEFGKKHMPDDKLVILQGLEDYIIVDSKDVLLICQKEKEQEIKEYVVEVKRNNGDQYL
mgnify:CR=1 FL=1